MRRALLLLGLAAAPALQAAASFDCTPPNEGNRPFFRAISKVRVLPETEAWAAQATKRGAAVHYVLSIHETIEAYGLCHWTVEVKADGELWKRFYVSPDGESVLAQAPSGKPSPRSDCTP